MTTLAELLGDSEPLPLTTPIEDREDDGMGTESPSHWITALALLAVLAGLAAVVAGVVLGGPWRWASGAAVAVGIAAIVVPGVADQGDKETEEDQR